MKLAIIVAWLVAEALRMPASVDPAETAEDRRARVEMIARSAAVASLEHADGSGWRWRELAAAVLVKQHAESRFALDVHSGARLGDRGKAACLGQLHQSRFLPASEWRALVGTDEDATLRCAQATARMLVAHARHCQVWRGLRANWEIVAITFASYGTGGQCDPLDSSRERAFVWARVVMRGPR